MAQLHYYDINDERNDYDLAWETAKIPGSINMKHGSASQFGIDSRFLVIDAEKRFRRVGGSDVGSSFQERTESPLRKQIASSRVAGESCIDRNLEVPRDGIRFDVGYKPHPLLCEGRLVWDVSVHPSKARVLSKGKVIGGESIEVDINASGVRFEHATVPPLDRMDLDIQCGDQRIPWTYTIISDSLVHTTICFLLEALHGVLQEPLDFDEWCCLDDTIKFDPGAIANKWSTHNARHLRLAKSASPSYHVSKEVSVIRRIDTLGNNTKFLTLKPSYDGGGEVQNRWVVLLGPKGD